ncbi:MAG: TonB-dependent receptor [Prevotella buccae]|uniref:SusC/RagA family TonB-linked outer membrane protein n=2 Tax=Segatella buccae TaxID=28126 RepID=UPI0001C4119A|nr:TonB-dependent receptor [Segatella buccae]EFC76369.1 TonB-linked outer membrane protein, SusC/RagA family [Segatella buccae D17]MBS5895917.1 TonB-dependent receptor [Segatella buccae]
MKDICRKKWPALCRLSLMTTVFFVFSVIGAHAQSVVTGSVKDGSGEPIIGATIMEKGTSNGGVTDLDGNFSIKVGDHATLVVSYVGYERQEVPVAGKSTVNIVLTESDRTIDEVVVVGYGAIAKRSVSTAISTVKGDRIAGMPTSNVAQSLVGMSSGITLQQVNGEPGAAPAIRIRGAGSINSGNDPLYVIDGYPTTDSELFNSISPTDIDDIQILKDAASSAIYGSKAGNGVIIVTTKSGRTGKPRVSFSTQIGVNQVQRYVDVLGSKDYLDMIIEARTNNGTIGNFPGLLKLRESGDYANTNWQDEIFRNALNYRANANVTGGNENVTYHFSVNYQNEDGILLNSYYRKVNVKGGFDARLNKYVKIGVGFSPTYTKKRAQQPAGGGTEDVTGVIAEALSYPPILPVWQPNGDYTQIAQHYTRYGLNNQLRNPVANLLENSNDSWSIRTLTNAYIEIKPLKSLTVRSSVDLSTNSTKLDYYQSACLLGANETGNKSTPNLSAIDAYRASGFGYNTYWSTTATYDRMFGEKHHLNAVLGYDFEYNSDFSVRQDDRTDADNPVAYKNTSITNVMGANLWTGSSRNTEYAFDALFGRVIYDYDSKYVVSGSLRRDRSSKFGPDNRSGLFYSGSLAWNITEEPWMKRLSWLTIAKVRTSYGVTGNDQIGTNYAWISTINTNHNVVFGNVSFPAYYPNGYSNRELGWEKNKQVDLGIDLAFFNRINLTVDMYRRTSDIVMPANIPDFNGIAGSVYMNSGEVENKGIEVQLNAKVLQGTFNWETTFNWSLNRNKILSLANNQKQLANGKAGTKWADVIRNYVGRPMGDMYMLKVIGTFNTEADLQKYAKKGAEALGDLIFEDVNGDKVIDTNDYQCVGNYQPDFTYGWTNKLGYKNFDLAVTIDGQVGGKVIYAAARAFTLNRYDDNVLAESGLNRWRSAEQPGNGFSHKAGTNNLGANISPSTRYLYNADFLRIRNIALGYTMPRKLCSKIGVESVRFSMNVQNLWTFDSYPGYSVEANYKGNSATNNGVDFGGYPISRVITFGVNLNF